MFLLDIFSATVVIVMHQRKIKKKILLTINFIFPIYNNGELLRVDTTLASCKFPNVGASLAHHPSIFWWLLDFLIFSNHGKTCFSPLCMNNAYPIKKLPRYCLCFFLIKFFSRLELKISLKIPLFLKNKSCVVRLLCLAHTDNNAPCKFRECIVVQCMNIKHCNCCSVFGKWKHIS